MQQSCTGCGCSCVLLHLHREQVIRIPGDRRTRRSDSRRRTELAGAAQSVGSMGCHTAKTRTVSLACRSSRDSTAEVPRRQVPHVGDNKMISLVSFAWRLKSARSSSRALRVDRRERRLASGCFTRCESVPCDGRRDENDESRYTERPSGVLHTAMATNRPTIPRSRLETQPPAQR